MIEAINLLVEADKLLAEEAIAFAEALPMNSSLNKWDKYNSELAKAKAHMAKANIKAAQGKAKYAIKEYKKAWEHAVKAVKYPVKYNDVFSLTVDCGRIPWWYYWYM